MTIKRIPIEDLFWPKVDKRGPDDCWEWKSFRYPGGYGKAYVGVDRETFYAGAHRVAYELGNGPIPEGLNVLHRCDNKPCCNPAHLFLGTIADNNADMRNKKRHSFGARHGIAKLTEDQVRAIRADGRTYEAIARDYGVSLSNVGLIRSRKTWRHVKP